MVPVFSRLSCVSQPIIEVGKVFAAMGRRIAKSNGATGAPQDSDDRVRGNREIAQPARMQAAFQNAHHGARRDIDVVLLPPPSRRAKQTTGVHARLR